MIRRIIHIDEGLCAAACHEGAIGMIDGKAKLLRDDYCDGLGDCLPACPTGAITFEEREAAAYDESAVLENKKNRQQQETLPCGCPGSQSREIRRGEALKTACATENATANTNANIAINTNATTDTITSATTNATTNAESQLRQWPVQIKLAPVNASYFDHAALLIAADCTAYAYGNFHHDFIRGKVTLIGCPKLDSVDYSEKLTEIIRQNEIKSVTIVRMEVPCCGGIERAAVTALKNSGKFIPWQVVTISTDGRILE